MIGKAEIMFVAGQTGLHPHVVEKDYALGWLLAGISAHESLSRNWMFKGGTCLKKCYFETYRFSEDLDFTLPDESHLEAAFLRRAFAEVGEWVYEQSGLELPADKQDFDIYDNRRGHRNCEGKISYRGPVSPTASGGWPRIKLDLTADERIVLAPVMRPVFHPYSDAPPNGINVQAYAYEEVFAEKIRALAERTRPRDLYDVISLFRNSGVQTLPSVILDVLVQKCQFKGIPLPASADLQSHRDELDASWENMLRHQLPALPPVSSFWDVLPEFFAWLAHGTAPATPVSFVGAAGATILRDRTLVLPVRPEQRAAVEIIRFAAANRLCVDLEYQGSIRRIEPYSLRRTKEGAIILHAWNVAKHEDRSYRLDRIRRAQATSQVFTPRYAVELPPAGPIIIPPTERRSGGNALMRHQGRNYVYECVICGKRFYRKSPSTTLKPHKSRGGQPCPGRTGHRVSS